MSLLLSTVLLSRHHTSFETKTGKTDNLTMDICYYIIFDIIKRRYTYIKNIYHSLTIIPDGYAKISTSIFFLKMIRSSSNASGRSTFCIKFLQAIKCRLYTIILVVYVFQAIFVLLLAPPSCYETSNKTVAECYVVRV